MEGRVGRRGGLPSVPQFQICHTTGYNDATVRCVVSHSLIPRIPKSTTYTLLTLTVVVLVVALLLRPL